MLFETESGINEPVDEMAEMKTAMHFTVHTYTDKGQQRDLPPFLTNPDYYFSLQMFTRSVEKEKLEEISDSECVTAETQD